MADGDRHKNTHVVGVRGGTKELAEAFRESARASGHGDLSSLTVLFWRWWLREEGVTLPQRPPADDH